MTFFSNSKSSKKSQDLDERKKTNYRTMMFGNLVSFLITVVFFNSCQTLAKKHPNLSKQELKILRQDLRAESRRISDSLYNAQRINYFVESQEQNNDLPQGEIEH